MRIYCCASRMFQWSFSIPGAFNPPENGALIVFREKKAAEDFPKGDPYVINGVVISHCIEEWSVVDLWYELVRRLKHVLKFSSLFFPIALDCSAILLINFIRVMTDTLTWCETQFLFLVFNAAGRHAFVDMAPSFLEREYIDEMTLQ